MVSRSSLLGFALFASHALSFFTPCPLLGPAFAPYTLDTNSSILVKSLKNLTDQFDNLMQTGHDSHGDVSPNTTSFSVTLFSTNAGTAADDAFFWEYHWTAPSLKSSSSNGVKSVDANSIYRIGGLTEIFTIWSVLIEAGDSIWNEPVTKYVPELEAAASAAAGQKDPVDVVDWYSITVGQLASHMSGISRDYGLNDLSTQLQNPTELGLPELSTTQSVPTCFLQSTCNRTEFFAGFTQQPPVVEAGTSPAYSNSAFQILGYVVENITGQPFESTLQTRILTPLGMNQTSLSTPANSSSGVIPGNLTASGWTTDYGEEAPAISMFSSVRDLSLASKSILASTLLPTSQTNRWLKPVTHTSNPANSVGYPWTVYSSGNYPNTSMIDLYTALDNFGLYSSYIGLVPDYNVGFAILAADTVSNADLNAHVDIVGEVIVEAAMEIAMVDANAAFAGTYQVTDNDPNNTFLTTTAAGGQGLLNTSITIALDTLPGMFMQSFISNGTDLRPFLAELYEVSDFEALSMRLYPTRLISQPSGDSSSSSGGGGASGSKIAFRAVYQDENAIADAGTPTCVSWMSLDQFKYGGAAMDLFVFELDADTGAVKSVEIPALRVTLDKVS